MASYRRTYKVGDTVYSYCATYNPGIITEVDGERYIIKWLNGKTTSGRTARHLASFDDLIQDHLKKVETHSNKRDKLRKEM